jgi:hypothetical protein
LFLKHKGVCNESLHTFAGAGFSSDRRGEQGEPAVGAGTIRTARPCRPAYAAKLRLCRDSRSLHGTGISLRLGTDESHRHFRTNEYHSFIIVHEHFHDLDPATAAADDGDHSIERPAQ